MVSTMSTAVARIRSDLDQLDGMADTTVVKQVDTYRVDVMVHPTKGTWKGGTYNFTFVFSEDYPFQGPKVRYTGPFRVFHPNIEGEADVADWGVCLGLQTQWRATFTLKDLIYALQDLFDAPNYKDPLPGVAKIAAQMLKDDEPGFVRVAQRWMKGDYTLGKQ